MSANPRFSTSRMAGLSDLGWAVLDLPAQAEMAATPISRADRMKPDIGVFPSVDDPEVTVVPFREEFRAAFEQLNRD
jgi:hypothetical protein